MADIINSKRLNDYFVVVGCNPSILQPLGEEEQPYDALNPLDLLYRAEIINRYPPIEDHNDCKFPSGISLFCLPDGLRISHEDKMPQFFSFVHTNGDGNRLYGNCLTFYEPLSQELRQELIEMTIECYENAVEENDIEQQESCQESLKIIQRTSSSMPLYTPKCLCLISHWPFMEQNRIWLTQLYRVSLSPSSLPLERYICNFISEVPAPIPGEIDIRYTILDEVINFSYAMPSLQTHVFSYTALDYELFFQCLSIENIVYLFEALLLEKQIVFQSSQYSLLAMCTEICRNFTYPIRWSHVYIPVLPRNLLGVLNAPMPFIVGLHTSFLDSIDFTPESIIMIDLDHNNITTGAEVDMKELPSRKKGKLIKELEEQCESIFMQRGELWSTLKLNNLDEAFSCSYKPGDDLIDDPMDDMNHSRNNNHKKNMIMKDVDWDAVHDSFLKCICDLMRGYRKYLIYPTKEEPDPAFNFKTDDFLESCSKESYSFLKVFLKTQGFADFVDDKVQPDTANNIHSVMDNIFDEKMEITNQKSVFKKYKNEKAKRKILKNIVKARTKVALEPDHSNIDTEVTYRYQTFPILNADLYSEPRPVPELLNNHLDNTNKSKNPLLKWTQNETFADSSTTVFAIWLISYTGTIGNERKEVKEYFLKKFKKDNEYLLHGSRDFSNCGDSLDGDVITELEQSDPTDQIIDASAQTPIPMKEDGQHMKHKSVSFDHLFNNQNNNNDNNNNENENDKILDNSEIFVDINVENNDENELGIPALPKKTHRRNESFEKRKKSLCTSRRRKSQSFSISRRRGSQIEGIEGLNNGDGNHQVENDLKVSNARLLISFSVLDKMKEQNITFDEIIFRSLIDACGRCGNTESAMQVLAKMHEAGFVPDSTVYSCLVGAFTNNDSDAFGKTLPLNMLDWTKYRTGISDNSSIGSHQRNASKDKFDMNRYSAKWKNRFSSTKNNKNKDSFNFMDKMFNNHNKNSDIATRHNSRDKSPIKNSEDKTTDLSSSFHKATIESDDDSGFHGDGFLHERDEILQILRSQKKLEEEVDRSNKELSLLFKDLHINMDRETCPDCNKNLTWEQIEAGFRADPNDYTTICPYCLEEANIENKSVEFSGNETEKSSFGFSRTSNSKKKSMYNSRTSSLESKQQIVRRFVARFEVKSSNEDWIGSTGPGTSLFCEFLSPWVLRKEVQRIIYTDGVDTLISPEFRTKNNSSMVIFWNLVICFQKYRLPVSFLFGGVVPLVFSESSISSDDHSINSSIYSNFSSRQSEQSEIL